MPRCKNNYDMTYTGKEPSPLGLGICATGFGVYAGMKKKGRDGNKWILREYVPTKGPTDYKYKWVKYDKEKEKRIEDKMKKRKHYFTTGEIINFSIEWYERKYKNSKPIPKTKLKELLGSNLKNILTCWLEEGIVVGDGKHYDQTIEIINAKFVTKNNKLYTICKAKIVDNELGNVICPSPRDLFAGMLSIWRHHLYAGGLVTVKYPNYSEVDFVDIKMI